MAKATTEETKPLSVTVEEVALHIFSLRLASNHGLKIEHVAEQCFEAAEAFIKVAQSRK